MVGWVTGSAVSVLAFLAQSPREVGWEVMTRRGGMGLVWVVRWRGGRAPIGRLMVGVEGRGDWEGGCGGGVWRLMCGGE